MRSMKENKGGAELPFPLRATQLKRNMVANDWSGRIQKFYKLVFLQLSRVSEEPEGLVKMQILMKLVWGRTEFLCF